MAYNLCDSRVSSGCLLAPVDIALICSRVKRALEGHGLESQVMFIELANSIALQRESILVVLGLNPSDSNVFNAPFLAPVDSALICSRVKKLLEGHGLESQVMFTELATYIVLLIENSLVVLDLNPLVATIGS